MMFHLNIMDYPSYFRFGQMNRGNLNDFSVSPSPFGTNWVLELIGTWMGLGLGGFGTKGLGPGLDNYSGLCERVIHPQ